MVLSGQDVRMRLFGRGLTNDTKTYSQENLCFSFYV